jgi:hypothetical protein
MQLKMPGVTEGARQEISDNDGLWTALYLTSQSFRYAAARSVEAREQAWRSMRALLRLLPYWNGEASRADRVGMAASPGIRALKHGPTPSH